jgi:hypothetical protein
MSESRDLFQSTEKNHEKSQSEYLVEILTHDHPNTKREV